MLTLIRTNHITWNPSGLFEQEEPDLIDPASIRTFGQDTDADRDKTFNDAPHEIFDRILDAVEVHRYLDSELKAMTLTFKKDDGTDPIHLCFVEEYAYMSDATLTSGTTAFEWAELLIGFVGQKVTEFQTVKLMDGFKFAFNEDHESFLGVLVSARLNESLSQMNDVDSIEEVVA